MSRPLPVFAMAALLVAGPALAQGASAVKPAASAAQTGVRTINWDALVQPNWDPYKGFRDVDMQSMQDGDPRANDMLQKLREAWNNAPVNTALAGQQVRIPGYVVPLEDSKDGITEFLLVPYFGACVHTPPPPSNQIIHVLPKTPAKGYKMMDTVWIAGPITAVQSESYMGNSSWRIEADSVTTFVEPKAGARPAAKPAGVVPPAR